MRNTLSAKAVAIAALVALAPLTVERAHAISETPPGHGAGGSAAPAYTDVPGVAVESGPSAGLRGAEESKDTSITIPGIGSVGAIPKLDFGLELLYGAQPETPAEEGSKEDDVLIRGTLKHRF